MRGFTTTTTGGCSAAAKDEDEVKVKEEEEELELGLSLGAKRVTGVGGKGPAWGEYCRILTAKDFPSTLGASSTSSVSSSSSPTPLRVGVTKKRGADSSSSDGGGGGGGSISPPSQAVVGWPPVRAFRMNSLVSLSKDNFSGTDAAAQKKKNHNNINNTNEGGHAGSCRFVKVNMDGDPIGRKVDLNAHQSYGTLALALEIMFHGTTTTLTTSTYGTNASKLLDGTSEFALTYEDKDGDWMLVGDVPWGMFLDTVRRLRIMRTSDANGLAPRFTHSHQTSGLIRS